MGVSKPLIPARQVCKLCGYDDNVTVKTLAPGSWELTCSVCPYSWTSTTASNEELAAAEGITAELGVYDDLIKCLEPGEPFVEYGTIEHRYSQLRPHIYQELLDRYGHTRHGPKHYTVSSFLGAALGRLRDRGEILIEFAEATGYWSYNGIICYCALPPGPADGAQLTYRRYAEALGMDPEV